MEGKLGRKRENTNWEQKNEEGVVLATSWDWREERGSEDAERMKHARPRNYMKFTSLRKLLKVRKSTRLLPKGISKWKQFLRRADLPIRGAFRKYCRVQLP